VLIRKLEKEMAHAAQTLAFEKAGAIKRQIAALRHIKDASLVGKDVKDIARRQSSSRRAPFRIEAYDVAHISGAHTVGVMVVVLGDEPAKGEYRKFKLKGKGKDKPDDIANLREILTRRLTHTSWGVPSLIVVDGGKAQKRAAEEVLAAHKVAVPVVAVVKDEKHKPRALIGRGELTRVHRNAIILANAESHRFAVAYHRLLRGRLPS
jgi:excinuclease ABC subunit C